MNPQQQSELEALIVDRDTGRADLVKMQELIGFREEKLYDFQDNIYRQIAMQLQIQMMTIRQIRMAVTGGVRVKSMMPKSHLIENWHNNVI